MQYPFVNLQSFFQGMKERLKVEDELVIGRPESVIGYVGQRIESGAAHLRDAIDRERPITVSKYIVPRAIKIRSGLDVVFEVGKQRVETGGFVCFHGVHLESMMKVPEVLQNICRLRPLPCAQEIWNRDCSQECYDCDHYHDFDESKTPAIFL